jgi:hypothetical protein
MQGIKWEITEKKRKKIFKIASLLGIYSQKSFRKWSLSLSKWQNLNFLSQ